MPDDREVAQDRPVALQQVVPDHAGNRGREGAGSEPHGLLTIDTPRKPRPRDGEQAALPAGAARPPGAVAESTCVQILRRAAKSCGRRFDVGGAPRNAMWSAMGNRSQ